MRRGDIWTVSGGKNYADKPRPVVVVQDDAFDATDSITICAFTTDPKSKLGERIGRLDDEDVVRLNRAGKGNDGRPRDHGEIWAR